MRINPWNVTIVCGCLITVFVFWAFFYLSFNLKHEQARSIEYDAVWSSTNGRNEFYKYAASVSRFLLVGSESDLEDAQVKFDIVMGRMEIWNSGSFRTFLNENEGLMTRFQALRSTLDELDALMQDLTPEKADQIKDLLYKSSVNMEFIASKSYQASIARFDAERASFRASLTNEKYIVMSLLVFATGLLCVVLLQNWNLTKANTRIAGTADQLKHIAKHDPLTSLANRAYVEEHLDMARRRMSSSDLLLVVALDLDGFKAVNDTLGHAGGDALLVALSKSLKDLAQNHPGYNLAARVGGDEFLLLFFCRRVDVDIDRTIHDILQIFKHPLETPVGSLLAGTSIGFAYTSEAVAVDTLVLNADLALTNAKSSVRGTAKCFEISMRTQFERRLQIERELPKAVKNGDIRPHYQLQHNLLTHELIGMEALARWENCAIGQVYPDEFIQIAEASGDILELGAQVLNSACRDVQAFPGDIPVSVNLSMVQLLNDDVVALVTSALEQTGLAPERLMLEVTESAVMKNIEAVTGVLSRLQALGVSIALDDFGTGYSSLSYLSNFKWDEIKIDKSFVAACETSVKALNIINVIRSLANKINARLMIEGLETESQVDLFRDLGCFYGQGFYFCEPRPIEVLCNPNAGFLDGTGAVVPRLVYPAVKENIS